MPTPDPSVLTATVDQLQAEVDQLNREVLLLWGTLLFVCLVLTVVTAQQAFPGKGRD